MKQLLICAASAAFVFTSAQALAGTGTMHQHLGGQYANGVCKPKIAAKNLKGAELKAAWKACKESPDSYN